MNTQETKTRNEETLELIDSELIKAKKREVFPGHEVRDMLLDIRNGISENSNN